MFSNKELKKLIIPLVIEQVLVMLVGIADIMMVSYVGEAAISGVGLIDMFSFMIITILTSIATGGAVIVSQYLGNKEKEKASTSASQLFIVNFLVSIFIMFICLYFNKELIGLFFGSMEVYSLSLILITIHNILAILLHPTSFNLSNSLRAAGDVKFTMFVGISSMIVFRLGSAILFGIVFNMGIIGVWIDMGIDWLARSVAFILRYRSGKWKEFRAI